MRIIADWTWKSISEEPVVGREIIIVYLNNSERTVTFFKPCPNKEYMVCSIRSNITISVISVSLHGPIKKWRYADNT